MNSAVAINARIFTSIIESFYTSQYKNNSGFNPLELILNRKNQYHEFPRSDSLLNGFIVENSENRIRLLILISNKVSNKVSNKDLLSIFYLYQNHFYCITPDPINNSLFILFHFSTIVFILQSSAVIKYHSTTFHYLVEGMILYFF